ncbi:MAG: ribonuclease HIII [Bacilli bacterium]|nr:ribonuclease HIII [Bacilli bacterium]
MNVVIKVDDETKNKMIEYYKDKVREKTPPYAIFQAQEEDTIITLYESGKVMFQGTSAFVDANMWKAIKENDEEDEDQNDYMNISSVGSDEVGTGDYFGPIVVTSTYVKKDDIDFLKSLGCTDSKKITDDKIKKIAPEIIKRIKYKSIILKNEEYNEKYSKENNMNKIKAIMHNKVLYSILNDINEKPELIIVDEFAREARYYSYLEGIPNVVKGITFVTKAESKNLAVAAASIISRYIFLDEFDKICDEYHLPLVKGSGHEVDTIGQEAVEKYGKEILDKIAKKNFSNTSRILKTRIV